MLKAYIDLLCQPSRALYIFLKYTKIPHTVHFVALQQEEHGQPEFERINPFKAVPAIDDNGFLLPESVAIMQYLCQKHNIDDLYPKDLVQRAKIEGFTHWQHLNIRFSGAGLFLALVYRPMRTGRPINQARVDLSAKVFKASLKKMENIYLKDTPFLHSDKMSIADLLGVCELLQPKLGLGMDVTAEFPKVEKWAELVRETVGPELFDEAHKPLVDMGEKIKQAQLPIPKL